MLFSLLRRRSQDVKHAAGVKRCTQGLGEVLKHLLLLALYALQQRQTVAPVLKQIEATKTLLALLHSSSSRP